MTVVNENLLGSIEFAGFISASLPLLLSELRTAQIEPAQSSPSVVLTFVEQQREVAAGVKQQLEADAQKAAGLRLLGERCMVIKEATAIDSQIYLPMSPACEVPLCPEP